MDQAQEELKEEQLNDDGVPCAGAEMGREWRGLENSTGGSDQQGNVKECGFDWFPLVFPATHSPARCRADYKWESSGSAGGVVFGDWSQSRT